MLMAYKHILQGMNISFEMKGEVENQKIAPLMFIPFIENSFKHGISNQISNGYVNMHLEKSNVLESPPPRTFRR